MMMMMMMMMMTTMMEDMFRVSEKLTWRSAMVSKMVFKVKVVL